MSGNQLMYMSRFSIIVVSGCDVLPWTFMTAWLDNPFMGGERYKMTE